MKIRGMRLTPEGPDPVYVANWILMTLQFSFLILDDQYTVLKMHSGREGPCFRVQPFIMSDKELSLLAVYCGVLRHDSLDQRLPSLMYCPST